MYSKKSIHSYFFKTKGFYILFIPVWVPYRHLYAMASAAGLKKTQEFGPILEQGKVFGFGWIGVEVEKPPRAREDVVEISGDFEVYEHKGPYKTLGKVCQKISKERPGAKMLYNLYLDNPEKTPAAECRTQILFTSISV